MKKIYLFLVILLSLTSCSKDGSNPNNGNPDGSDATLSYKVNDTLVQINGFDANSASGVICYKFSEGNLFGETFYKFNAQLGTSQAISFTITTDSLAKGNYHYAITEPLQGDLQILVFNSNGSSTYQTGDYLDFNVTETSNGLVSGNFTAKMTRSDFISSGPFNSTNVTEGKFKNVKVIY